MKQVIATEQNTDVWALAQILNEEQVAGLISALQQQGKLFIPQFYQPSHVEYYGFKDIDEMGEVCQTENGIYGIVDQYVKYFSEKEFD
jgi:hypothetical protein